MSRAADFAGKIDGAARSFDLFPKHRIAAGILWLTSAYFTSTFIEQRTGKRFMVPVFAVGLIVAIGFAATGN